MTTEASPLALGGTILPRIVLVDGRPLIQVEGKGALKVDGKPVIHTSQGFQPEFLFELLPGDAAHFLENFRKLTHQAAKLHASFRQSTFVR